MSVVHQLLNNKTSIILYLIKHTNTNTNKSNSELFVFVSCRNINVNFEPLCRVPKLNLSFRAISTALLWTVSSVCCACGNAKQIPRWVTWQRPQHHSQECPTLTWRDRFQRWNNRNRCCKMLEQPHFAAGSGARDLSRETSAACRQMSSVTVSQQFVTNEGITLRSQDWSLFHDLLYIQFSTFQVTIIRVQFL
jgi:hypothetical protein